MTCIIVDDNKMARAAMNHLIAEVDFLSLKQECENPIDAFNYLKKETVDLVFLDVEMPGMSGIELVKNLDKRPIIILITAKKDYAVEAFELNVADYIVKPVTLPRFMTAVSRAKELFESKDEKIDIDKKYADYIFVRSKSVITKIKSVITKIKIEDIIYVQALGDYVNIYTGEKRHTVHITLSGIESKLPQNKFFRLHRSYIIALDHINDIEENCAYIGKHPIPIGEQYKKSLMNKLNFI